jgi:hypothetical protein
MPDSKDSEMQNYVFFLICKYWDTMITELLCTFKYEILLLLQLCHDCLPLPLEYR